MKKTYQEYNAYQFNEYRKYGFVKWLIIAIKKKLY